MPRKNKTVPSAKGQREITDQVIMVMPSADGSSSSTVDHFRSADQACDSMSAVDDLSSPVPDQKNLAEQSIMRVSGSGDPPSSTVDQPSLAEQAMTTMSSVDDSSSPVPDQNAFADQANFEVSGSGDPPSSTVDHCKVADQAIHPMSAVDDLSPVIALIRGWHRRRCYAMEQRKRSDLSIMSFLRVQLGWSRSLKKADADKIAKHARDLVKLGEKIQKGKAEAPDDPVYLEWAGLIAASLSSRAPWDAEEAVAVAAMTNLAQSLPVWPVFGEPIRGFGPMSLAVIVGEAGDLSKYANPGKLWKRMGLAVMDGIRQGGLRKNAAKEDWIAHGYNRARRSRVFVIGDALIKNNKTEYRAIYDQRKTFERDRDPEMTPMHSHRRAQRYMEKRLLKNLWQSWRRATLEMNSRCDLPAVNSSAQAERSASSSMTSIKNLPGAKKKRATQALKPNRSLPASPHQSSPHVDSKIRVPDEAASSSNNKRDAGLTAVLFCRVSVPVAYASLPAERAISVRRNVEDSICAIPT